MLCRPGVDTDQDAFVLHSKPALPVLQDSEDSPQAIAAVIGQELGNHGLTDDHRMSAEALAGGSHHIAFLRNQLEYPE